MIRHSPFASEPKQLSCFKLAVMRWNITQQWHTYTGVLVASSWNFLRLSDCIPLFSAARDAPRFRRCLAGPYVRAGYRKPYLKSVQAGFEPVAYLGKTSDGWFKMFTAVTSFNKLGRCSSISLKILMWHSHQSHGRLTKPADNLGKLNVPREDAPRVSGVYCSHFRPRWSYCCSL